MGCHPPGHRGPTPRPPYVLLLAVTMYRDTCRLPRRLGRCGEAVPSVWFTFRTLQKSDSACYPEQGCCRSTPSSALLIPRSFGGYGEAEGPAAWVSPLFDKAQDFSYPFPL